MKRAAVISILAAATLGLLAAAEPAQTLGGVHKIYVMPFAAGGDMIREKVISRLINSGKVTVVNTAEEADAILTGTTDDHQGVFRLVGKSNEVLWIGEGVYRANRVFGHGIGSPTEDTDRSGQVATRAVNTLLKAMQKAKR